MFHTREQALTLFEQKLAFLKVRQEGHVLYLTLNRPEKKNALHPVLVNELAYAAAYAHYTKDIRVVVLSAEGDVFCSGADLKAFAGDSEEVVSTAPMTDSPILMGEIFRKMHKPCIARVHGNAFAGAFLLLGSCHYVVAADHARFGLPEVKRGLFPFQVLACLLDLMPARKAIDWCIRGVELGAQEACDLGLVTHVTAADKLDDTVAALVAEISENSPNAIRLGLQAFEHLRASSPSGDQEYMREMLMIALQSDDAREGIMAFREKRKPVWTGE